MLCCVRLVGMDGWEQKKEEIQPLEAKRANEQRRNAEIEKVGRQAVVRKESEAAGLSTRGSCVVCGGVGAEGHGGGAGAAQAGAGGAADTQDQVRAHLRGTTTATTTGDTAPSIWMDSWTGAGIMLHACTWGAL